MSHSNKKKKTNTPSRKPLKSYIDISQHYYNEYVRVAHKLLEMSGMDPAEFDVLTKRTKHQLMLIKHTPYRVMAEKGSSVPRAYLKFFNYIMGLFGDKTFYGDPKYNVTFKDYMTYGMSFGYALRSQHENRGIISDDQHQQLEKIKEKVLEYIDGHEQDDFLVRSNAIMRMVLMYVSMPNYRYYTSTESGEMDSLKCRMQNLIRVSSFEPEKRAFFVKGEKHSSYKLWHHDLISESNDPNPLETQIPIPILDEKDLDTAIEVMKNMETIVQLPVYIQNHALHRIRQRLDCMDNLYINTVFGLSFIIPHLITANNGQRLIRAIDNSGKPVGYFPFLRQDGAILIRSFLPLASPVTPEGAVLYKELGIMINDSKYFGMDKLSFYFNTDFEALPILKQALQKANMWHLTEIQTEQPKERKEDQILKRFFSAKYDTQPPPL